ncbi:MAG: tetratricopeptide repeat protein [Prolixibacteraceae bacterium]|jgi:tetratricopeptide (TPR) repeat protein|nr:tetratricopeptide repeat protein [Prolixibacteraceae bacterium]
MQLKYLVLLIAFAGLLSSCGNVRHITETVPPVKEEEPEYPALSDDKQNEFEYLYIEGLKQKQLGNLQAAVSLFSRCLEIDPNSAAAMFELANIHLSNKDLASASLLLEKAVEINPENKWYKIQLARVYQQTKRFDKAASLYGQLYEAKPDEMENLEYLYMKATILSAAKKYDEAIAAFDLLESKLGFNEQVVIARQQVYVEAGNTEKAAQEINRLIEFAPEDTRYYGLMADMYLDQGDSLNALEYYNKILEMDPENGFVNFSLAGYYQKTGDIEKAYTHIREGFKNRNIGVETKLQMFLMLIGDPQKQVINEKQTNELMGLLRAMYPDNFQVKAMYVDFLLQKNQLEEARVQLRGILETDQGNYNIWERLLLVDNDLLDFENLYTDSKVAIERFPDQPLFYALHALACLQKEQYEETLKIISEGESYVLDNNLLAVQFALYKAEANYKLDRVEEAFNAFDEVIKLDPDNYMALNNYAYYLSLRDENLDKAARMSGKAVQANPQNATYLDTYAWVLFRQKEYKLAKFYQESAIQNGGDQNAVILEHYGDILFMLGEKGKAVEYWKKAIEAGEGTEFLEEKIKKGQYIE